MCVAAFAWRAHPRWHLVAIGNRDEYHERPASPLAHWDEPPGVIAGRDLQSGGTWLGVSEAGRFALVTNLRGFGGPDPSRRSRGALVTEVLAGAGQYADPASARLQDFNPFNLIVANGHDARFLSNRPEDIRTTLAHGIYGLSNGALDEPWAKTLQLKTALLDWLNADSGVTDRLLEALADEVLPPIGIHPTEPSDVQREAPETAVFIRSPVYGTRCSTVVAIDRSGAGIVIERRFARDGGETGTTKQDFAWPL